MTSIRLPKHMARFLELNPSQSILPIEPCFVTFGGSHINQHHFDPFSLSCRKVAQLMPKNSSAHNDLGTVLLKKGDTDAAIRSFKNTTRSPHPLQHLACHSMSFIASHHTGSNQKSQCAMIILPQLSTRRVTLTVLPPSSRMSSHLTLATPSPSTTLALW